MNKLDISVIILTYNEEIHIRRCIENVAPFVKEIFIIDSFSTDRTGEIAREYVMAGGESSPYLPLVYSR